ncbi:MAG: protein kinase [Phycisphaera sp.]|nr:protein kinase [Phycisphaera sp.]
MDLLAERVDQLNCGKCGHALDPAKVKPLSSLKCPKCGNKVTVPALFGDYLLISAMGQGAAGIVCKALDQKLHRQVAIKILKRGDDNAELVKACTREARALASLNHPHVVQVHTIGEYRDQHYIVMELLDGGSVQDLFKQPIDEAKILDLAIDVAEGLKAAHQRGLVHMDVKPANMLFDRQKSAKLIDFGVAQAGKKQSDQIVGTPYYVAPEVVKGEATTHQADIYSLGASLFHLLSRRPPFTAENAIAVIKKRLRELPPPLIDIKPDIHPRTSEVVARMLEPDPVNNRYKTYDELIADLKDARAKLDSYEVDGGRGGGGGGGDAVYEEPVYEEPADDAGALGALAAAAGGGGGAAMEPSPARTPSRPQRPERPDRPARPDSPGATPAARSRPDRPPAPPRSSGKTARIDNAAGTAAIAAAAASTSSKSLPKMGTGHIPVAKARESQLPLILTAVVIFLVAMAIGYYKLTRTEEPAGPANVTKNTQPDKPTPQPKPTPSKPAPNKPANNTPSKPTPTPAPKPAFADLPTEPAWPILVNEPRPKWIWVEPRADNQTAYFRTRIDLESTPHLAQFAVSADDECSIYVNGRKVGEQKGWQTPVMADVTAFLKRGDNVIGIEAKNNSGNAGVVGKLVVGYGNDREQVFITDDSWNATRTKFSGWESAGYDASSWSLPTVVCEFGQGEWKWLSLNDPSKYIKQASTGTPTNNSPTTTTPSKPPESYPIVRDFRIDQNKFSPDTTQLNGDARIEGDGSLTLTPAENEKRGSAFYKGRALLKDGFTVNFRFKIENSGIAADGFAFVLTPDGPESLGSTGGGLGYADDPNRSDAPEQKAAIREGLAIEFDTYKNEGGDEDGITVHCVQNGSLNARQNYNVDGTTKPQFNMADGRVYPTTIAYDAKAHELHIDVTDPNDASKSLSKVVKADLTKIKTRSRLDKDGAAFIGFTAATGGENSKHRIFDFSFKSGQPAAAKPEPAPTVASTAKTTRLPPLYPPNAQLADEGGWNVLDIVEATSESGLSFTKADDGSIMVSGATPANDIYTLKAVTTLSKIQAYRLDAMTHASLPKGGPGLSDGNGNFIITDIQVESATSNRPSDLKAAKLSDAKADFEQGDYKAEAAIDGDATKTGWGIYGKTGQSHHLVFKAPNWRDATPDDPVLLTITIAQKTPHARHVLGRFRLSATTSKTPHALKDEPTKQRPLSDVGFIALVPSKVTSKDGAKVAIKSDGTVLVEGDAGGDVYTVTADTDIAGITGFRLEALPDDSLPEGGPGLARGNFAVAEFAVEAAPKGAPNKTVRVNLTGASADYSDERNTADKMIDGSTGTAWAVINKPREARVAIVMTTEPVGGPNGSTLTFTISNRLNLGCFRILATSTSDKAKLSAESAPAVVTPDKPNGAAKANDNLTVAADPKDVEYYFNVGGDDFNDPRGKTWKAAPKWVKDKTVAGYESNNGGKAETIAGMKGDPLIGTYWNNIKAFRAMVPKGNYKVILFYAEPNADTEFGKRQMEVKIEGKVYEKNFEILKGTKGAAFKPYWEVYEPITVKDAGLSIEFRKSGGDKNPVLSAVSIIGIGP